MHRRSWPETIASANDLSRERDASCQTNRSETALAAASWARQPLSPHRTLDRSACREAQTAIRVSSAARPKWRNRMPPTVPQPSTPPERATGRSRRPWRFRRRDTSNLSKAATVQSFRRRRPIMASPSLQRSSPGARDAIRDYGKKIEKGRRENPSVLAALKLHYLRWVLFNIGGEPVLHVSGDISTPTSTSTPKMPSRSLRCKLGVTTVFENLGGLPDGLEDERAGIRKIRARPSCPSFLEYGEYPYVTADEIKKALKVKASLSSMLDQMQ